MGDSPRNVLDNSYQSMRSHHGMSQNRINQDQIPNTSVPGNQQNTQQMFDMFSNMMKMMMQQNGQSPTNFPNPSQLQNMMNQQKLPGVPSNTNLMNAPQINSSTGNVLDSSFRNFEDRFNHQQTDLLDFYEKMGKQPQSLSPIPGASNQQGYSRQNQREGQNTKINQRDQLGRQQLYQQQQQPNSFELSATSEQLPFKSDFVDYDFQNQSQNISAIANNPSTYSQKPSRNPRDKDLEEAINSRNYGNNQAYGRYDYKQDERNNNDFNQRKGYQDNYQRNDEQQQQDLAQSLSPSASKQRNNDFNYQRNNNQKGQTRGEDQSQKNLDYNSGLGFGQKYSTDHNYPQIEKDFIPKNQGNTFQDDKNFSKRQQQFQQPYDDEPARDYRNFAERGNDYYDFKPKNKQVEDFEIGNQSGKRNRDWGYENEFLRESMQFNNNSSNLQGDQQFNQNSKNQQSMKQQQGIQKSNITTTADDRLFNDDKNDSENGKPFNQKPQLNNQNIPLNDEDRPIKTAKNNNYTSNLQNKNSRKEFSDGDSVVVVSSKSRNTGFSSGLPDEREEIPREAPDEHRINPFEEIPIKTNGGSKRFEDLIEEQLQQEEEQHNNEGEDWHDAGEKRPKNFLKKGTRSFLSNAQQRSKAASNHIETINTQQAGDTLDSTVVVPFTKPKSKKSALPSGKGTTLPPGSSISARNTLSSNNMAASSVQLLNKPSKQSLNYNQSQAGFENTNNNQNNSQHNQNSAPELDLDTPTDAGNGQKAKKKFLQRGKGKGGGIQGATSSSNIQNKKEEEKQNKETNEKPSQSSLARPKTSTKVETYDLISVDSGSKNQSEDEGYAKNKSYQPNRYLKQEEQEGERNKGVLQFDDEEEWGDTAAQKKKEIKKRTQSGQQQQVRSGEDQDEHEETNDAYDYDENNDQEQYSKVVQKYFNKKPSQKQAQSTSQGESEKQFDPSKPNIEEYTNEQIEKLNAEISKFKLENERVRKMRAKYEDLLKSFTKEKEQFAKQKEIEVQELEEWKKEEQKKIRNEKRIAERQQKASANMPNRKEREEIEGYKATIKKLQDEIKMKDSRNKLAMERTKKQLEEQVARNQELLDEIREMEKARVDLSKNGLKSQSNQLSSRVQQPQVKSTTSRDERSISSLSKKNQKQNSAADFQFDNNTAWKRDKNNEFQAHSENWIRNGDQEEEDEEETYEKYQGEVEENSQSQDDEEDDYRGKGKGQKGKHMKERSSSQPNVDFDEEEEEEFKNGGGNQDEHDGQEEDDEEIEKYEDIINFNPTNHSNNNMNMNSQGNSYNRAKTEQSKHTAIVNNAGPNSQRQLPNSKNSTIISNNTNISNNNNSLLNKSSSASKNNNIHQNNNISNRSANQTINYIPTTTNSALPNSKSNNPPPALKKNNLPSQLDKKGQNPKWKYDLTQLSKIDNIGIAMINRDIDINQFNYNGNPLYKEYTSIYSQVGKIIQQNNTQDGKIQREFENGTIEVTFPNKVRRQILKNGLTIIEFVNSDVKQVLPDQTIIYYFADAGTTQITLPSAVNIYKFPNDQIEIHFPSGKKEIKFCDGTARYVFEDGVEKTYFPDGSVQTVDINRIKTITHANESTVIAKMIEAVFAGEFDLLKGCVVKAHVPEYLEYNEIALAAYMLPDGVQKSDSDISVFKYHLSWDMPESEYRNIQLINQNDLSELVDLYKYTGEEWKLIQESCVLSVSNRGDTLYFSAPYVDLSSACQVFAYQTHNDIQFKKLKDDFYSFYTIKEGESIGINFKSNISSERKQKIHLEEFLKKFEDRRLFESSIRMSAVSDTESCKVSQNDQEMLVKKPHQDGDNEGNLKKSIKVEEEYLFYTLIRNKRDSSIKRGCLTRALSIASSRNDILHYFEPVLKYFLEIYIEFPIIEDDILPVQKLLSDMLNQINSLTNIPPHILSTPKTKFIHNNDILSQFEQPESEILEIQLNDHFQFSITHNNYFETNASLVDLFNRFGQNIMKIWLGLLKELRVLFIGYDRSVRECVNAASAAALLITPFNTQKRLQMYCHLQDLSFTEQQGYIAAVSNPLFENRDSWWDLCCNLNDGSIRESEKVNVMDRLYEKRVSNVDEEFYKEAKKILDEKKKNQTESKHHKNENHNNFDDSEWTLRELFRNYTKCTVDMLVNSANLVDYRNEDKPLYEGFRKRKERFGKTTMWKWLKEEDEEERCRFKQLFGGPASAVLFESLLIVKDTRILNDLELITLYSAIATNAKTTPQLALILRYLFARKNSLDVLGIGLFSKSSEVVKQNFKLLTLFETFPIGKQLLKSLSFIMLYTYENFKSKINVSC